MCHESWLINSIYQIIGVPIAASSVNISGQNAAISIDEVTHFKEDVELIIDGGITKYQVNGTVLDLTEAPIIQREGAYLTKSYPPNYTGSNCAIV
jgi:tRNA A37 threonylcarbamoyladenosine synthetase subunit TsaC/SUA5/YrdC